MALTTRRRTWPRSHLRPTRAACVCGGGGGRVHSHLNQGRAKTPRLNHPPQVRARGRDESRWPPAAMENVHPATSGDAPAPPRGAALWGPASYPRGDGKAPAGKQQAGPGAAPGGPGACTPRACFQRWHLRRHSIRHLLVQAPPGCRSQSPSRGARPAEPPSVDGPPLSPQTRRPCRP